MKKTLFAILALCSLSFAQTTIFPKTTVFPKTTIFGAKASGGAPAFIQAAQNHFTVSSTTSTVGNAVGSGWSTGNVTAGDTLVVIGDFSGTTTFTASDSLGTPTVFSCITATAGLTAGNFFICNGKATATGADLITVTSAASVAAYLVAMEFSGVTSGSLDQQTSGNVAACTSCTLTSITTTQGTGVSFGCGGTDAANATFTQQAPYIIPTNGKISASGQAIGCEYLITSSTAIQTPVINIGVSTAISGLTFNIF